jgi:GNAT superfamily N-acetyltransferase
MISIREFSRKDTKTVLDFREQTGRISFPGKRMDRKSAERDVLRHIERYPGTIMIAWSATRPVGFIRFRPKTGEFGKYGYVNIIFVEQGFRHKGVGALLLREAENWFHSKGIRSIQATITNSNRLSLDFFKKEGYLSKRTVVEKRL